jgi:ubiquitin-protein ligase
MQNMDITSSSAKARIRDVTKAVTALQGQLPIAWSSSVHVAIDENRPDLFRVLVFPDEDTPYAHGAFLFDFLLPSDFPNQPPKVHITLTLSLLELLSS